jgi:hypothetical protein
LPKVDTYEVRLAGRRQTTLKDVYRQSQPALIETKTLTRTSKSVVFFIFYTL